VTEAVFTLELNNFVLLVELRVHAKNPRKCSLICDAAERSPICGTLEQMPEAGFHKVDELLIGCVLRPTPLEILHTLG
jgi:hypothetical protein